MNALIVYDNKIARTTMKQLASQVKDIVLTGECANAMDAYNLLQEQPVDIIFLDIEMPGMTGLELIKTWAARSLSLSSLHPKKNMPQKLLN